MRFTKTMDISDILDEEQMQKIQDNMNYDDIIPLIKQKMSVVEELEKEVSPDDVKKMDMIFVNSFLTYKMAFDLPYICKDFFMNCYVDFQEGIFENYIDEYDNIGEFYQIIGNRVIGAIYCLAKQNHEYARQLMLHLYKTYYKKEYNQLKRFKTLNAMDIIALCNHHDWRFFSAAARILSLCQFMNIEKDSSCNLLYYYFKRYYNDFQMMKQDIVDDFIQISEDTKEESKKIVSEWLKYIDEPYEENRQLRQYCRAKEFLEIALELNHIDGNYVSNDTIENFSIPYLFSYTLSLLKTKHPKREYTFEQVQTYAAIFQMALSFSIIIKESQSFFYTIFPFSEEDKKTIESGLYKSFCMEPVKKSVEAKTKILNLSDDIQEEQKNNNNENLYKENEELKKKLKEKEQEIKNLKHLYSSVKEENTTLTNHVQQYSKDKNELIALRNHVYHLTEEDIEISSETMDEMEEFLKDKRIVIIGGHDNWTYKLREKFKNWEFFQPKASAKLNEKILVNADYVYFFTDYISHNTYERCLSVIRSYDLPFGYIHSINIKSNIQEIYNDIKVG